MADPHPITASVRRQPCVSIHSSSLSPQQSQRRRHLDALYKYDSKTGDYYYYEDDQVASSSRGRNYYYEDDQVASGSSSSGQYDPSWGETSGWDQVWDTIGLVLGILMVIIFALLICRMLLVVLLVMVSCVSARLCYPLTLWDWLGINCCNGEECPCQPPGAGGNSDYMNACDVMVC